MHGRTEMPTPTLPARGRGGISCCVKLLQHRGRWEMSPHSNMLQTQQVLTSRLTLDCCEHNSSGSADLFSFPWHQILPFSQSRWHLGDIHIYKLFNTLWCHDTSVTAILDLESKPSGLKEWQSLCPVWRLCFYLLCTFCFHLLLSLKFYTPK